MAAAEGVRLHHIARESADVKRLAAFYQEVRRHHYQLLPKRFVIPSLPLLFLQVLGFELIDSPKFGEFKVIWLRLPPSFSLHLIEKNPESKLPEGPSTVADPSALPRGHHISFAVSNYDAFVQAIKVRSLL